MAAGRKKSPLPGLPWISSANSVSLDGNRALVGAVLDDDDGVNSGSAYIFAFDGMTWTLEAKLTAPDGAADDKFGISVSLSGDRALVGAYGDDDDGSNSGSVYTFSFNGESWMHEAKLTAIDGTSGERFGSSVSLDGHRALIGAIGGNRDGISPGAAYVFDFDGTSWLQDSKLTAIDGQQSDWFGGSVSLDGNRALVGAERDDDNGSASGSAYVFVFDGEEWMQEAWLTASDGAADDLFGHSVSLSSNRALIGAVGNDAKGFQSGSAYMFSFDGTSWSQEIKLLADDGEAADQFWQVGQPRRITRDCRSLSDTMPRPDTLDSGSAYVFVPGWPKLDSGGQVERGRSGYGR